MLLIDNRVGSKELAEPLANLGLPVELTTLEFGDISFAGRGIGGEVLQIGIEFKKLGELVQALSSGRLAGHQLPGMVQGYERRYLLIEGEWITNAAGMLQRRTGQGEYKPLPGAPPVAELLKRLLTYAHRGGMTPWPTKSRADTLRWIAAAYRFWTDKDLDEHKSHIAIYNADVDSRLGAPTSQFRHTASTLPAIGAEASRAAELKFGSIYEAVIASADDWAGLEVNGKRLGTKRAEAIVRAIHGDT